MQFHHTHRRIYFILYEDSFRYRINISMPFDRDKKAFASNPGGRLETRFRATRFRQHERVLYLLVLFRLHIVSEHHSPSQRPPASASEFAWARVLATTATPRFLRARDDFCADSRPRRGRERLHFSAELVLAARGAGRAPAPIPWLNSNY